MKLYWSKGRREEGWVPLERRKREINLGRTEVEREWERKRGVRGGEEEILPIFYTLGLSLESLPVFIQKCTIVIM